jgi:dienelactone hydrolase
MPKSFSSKKLLRRTMLQGTALGLGSLTPLSTLVSQTAGASASASASPQASATTPKALAPFNHFPRMMQDYFCSKVAEAQKRGDRRRDALKSKADAEAYVQDVRQKIRQCFGPWPQKAPLNARVTGALDRDSYRIEKVIFESRPNFPVTANLYLPARQNGPGPGVVSPCGHAQSGKADPESQAFGQSLAHLGYSVLIYDPVGQAERMQYVDAQLKSRHGGGTSEHLYAGNQQFLVGEFFGTWRVWDGIRALDYLLSRPEVDPRRIGVTGHSGGGTITGWLTALEDRWCVSAPSCFVTTFLRNMQNELPADPEQCPPHALALGLDHSDFIAAFAPKPVILLDEERDFFDVRGLQVAFDRLKKLYTLLGAPDNVQMSIGPAYHSYGRENREAMYAWFNRATKTSGPTAEPEVTVEKEETLWCTPHGQVAEANPRTLFSFTKEISTRLDAQRKSLGGAALTAAVTSALKLEVPKTPPDYRVLRPSNNRMYPKKYAGTYAVETEPGVFSLVYRLSDESLTSRIPRGPGRAILYVSHHSADEELRIEPLIAEVITQEKDSAVFACDVRGIGESQPNTCGAADFAAPYASDYFYAIHSIMLDRPYVGQKAYDVLRLVNLLKSSGHGEVHIVAKGWGAVPATYAALLSSDVTQITLKNAPASYSAIAESQDYGWPLSSFIPGVLKTFDLPDCYRALESKGLRQIDPANALGILGAAAG